MAHEGLDLLRVADLTEPGAEAVAQGVPDVVLWKPAVGSNLFEPAIELVFVGPVISEEIVPVQAVHEDWLDLLVDEHRADVAGLGDAAGLATDPDQIALEVHVLDLEL